MSRGQNFSRFNAGARSFLEADVGPVDDEDCAVGPCDDDAVYRVPWPQFGGDVAYCPYHLARFRAESPDEWDRVQEYIDDSQPETERTHTNTSVVMDLEKGHMLATGGPPCDTTYREYTLGAS